MNKKIPEDHELENFLRETSELPTMSHSSKDDMLKVARDVLASPSLKTTNDYTWMQFLSRSAGLAAILCVSVSIANAYTHSSQDTTVSLTTQQRTLSTSSTSPVPTTLPKEIEKYLTASQKRLIAINMTHKYAYNNEHTWLAYTKKGMQQ